MGKKRSRDKRLFVAKDMPPLRRTQPGCEYSYKTDEVMDWISKRPGLQMYVMDKLIAGGYLVFDVKTGRWQGVDYEN